MASTSNTAQRDYIETQIKAFIDRIGDTGTWDKASALSELSDWIDSATFKVPRKARAVTTVSSEDQCMARSWALGVGGQCKKAKHGDGDFCKCCAKKFAVCKEPASFNMDGSHKGLFWGRVDEALPIEAADGKGVAIMWKSDEVKDQIRELLDDGGSWHPFCTHPPCRTADWEATPITTMTSRKKKSKKSKSKKTKSKRTKNAYLFFMGDARPQITANLLKFVEDTQMTPGLGVHFLSENGNDINVALTAFKKLQKKKKFFKKRLNALDIEGDGKVADDFVFKGKYAMGPIGKLGGALWGKMSDAEKKPFKDMADEAKAAVVTASDDESEDVDEDVELEESEVENDEANSDDDELEIEDVILDDGTTIMVDERNLIYSEDGEEIGVFDSDEKKASYYEDQ